MEAVTDVFAFALTRPDLWTGLFFHDRKEEGDIQGITEAEWQALDAARPHLQASADAWLRVAHATLRARAQRSTSASLERVRRSTCRLAEEGRWRYVQTYLASSYRSSVYFGLTDDLDGPIRPYVAVWGRSHLRKKIWRAAERVEAPDDVVRMDHHRSIVWVLPPFREGHSFQERAQSAVGLVWPAVKRLSKQFHNQPSS